MYNAIYYSYRDRVCHLRDDNEGWHEFQYQPTYYKLHPEGKYATLDGKRANPTKKYDKDDKTLYEKDVDKCLTILLDIYRDSDDVASYQNKVFLDIETERGEAINLGYCQRAPMKVTAIALYDEQGKHYYAYVLDEAKLLESSSNDSTSVISCHTESTLLLRFLDKWKEIDPTIVIHWNGDSFDIPYLYNRMKKIVGAKNANSLSPLNIVEFDERDPLMPYKIAGISSLDYMRLYKKFIPRQQPSYALEAISQKELGKGKIKYDGSLDKLFKEDIAKFIEYNINDVRLIVEMDLKKKFIDLAVMVCHMGHVPYQYVYESSRVLDGAIMTYLKRKEIVSPNKPTTTHPELRAMMNTDSDEEDEKFAGAYVKEPIPGLYGWNFDLDIESEYPSAGILLNVGIETFKFKVAVEDGWDDSWNLKEMKLKDPNQEIYVENIDGELRPTTVGTVVQLIEKNSFTVSPNGVVFDASYTSILSEVMNSWFIKRKEFKQTMIKYGKEGNHKMESFYDLYQQVMKVFLNSIYGCLGLKSFRYSDGKDYLASAITATGRVIITRSADYANAKYHREYDSDASDIVDYCLMSDTDSMYLAADQILKARGISLEDDAAAIPEMRRISKEFADDLNNYYATEFTKAYFNSSNNRVKIKSETIAKSLYISAKKQYAQYIVDKEGITKSEFDYKGLDFTKSSYPPLFRDFVKSLIEDVLFGKKKAHIDKRVIEFRERFKSFDITEVAKPTGINKYKEYIGIKPTAGKIFSTVRPHCPVNTKASIFHNDLLMFKRLNKTYPVIQPGDKILWIYLKANPYNIDVIAINKNEPCPDIYEFMVKYLDRETMFDKTLVKKLDKIYENLSWGNINLNPKVGKFMKFL
jgi:DNA polymerase elongation subunit (family B)